MRTLFLRAICLGALLASSACATAPSAVMRDTSFAMADGSRAIQLSTVLPAPPAEVYRTLSTAEGWKTWAVPIAFGGGGVGSFMETSYNPAAKPGDAGNIMQQFIALIPDRLVVFRTTKTPAGFPNADLYMKTVAIMELAPEGSGTRFTFTYQGFGKEPGFDQLYDFFSKGYAETLETLRKLFAEKAG